MATLLIMRRPRVVPATPTVHSVIARRVEAPDPILTAIRDELRALPRIKPIETAEPSDHLTDDLGLDSLERVTIAMALEEMFGTEIPDRIVARWQTVADVIASVRERVGVETARG